MELLWKKEEALESQNSKKEERIQTKGQKFREKNSKN